MGTPSGTEKETLLNLGVATIMSDVSEEMSPRALEKLRVGLQYCKTGSEKHVQVDWHGNTGTAVIKFKVRARRIRQHNDGWELKDDAGSGIRGKSHESSAFRFWACLQHSDFSLENSKPVDDIIQAAIHSNSGAYRFADARVWSKGNCPSKSRKISPRSPKHQVSAQPAPSMAGLQQQMRQLNQMRQMQIFMPVGMPVHLAPPAMPELTVHVPHVTAMRGTKRPTIFTNIPATTPQVDPRKRMKVEGEVDYLLQDDDGLDDELGFMVDTLCGAGAGQGGEEAGMDEIESIINSFSDDGDDSNTHPTYQRQLPHQEEDDILLALPELNQMLGLPVC